MANVFYKRNANKEALETGLFEEKNMKIEFFGKDFAEVRKKVIQNFDTLFVHIPTTRFGEHEIIIFGDGSNQKNLCIYLNEKHSIEQVNQIIAELMEMIDFEECHIETEHYPVEKQILDYLKGIKSIEQLQDAMKIINFLERRKIQDSDIWYELNRLYNLLVLSTKGKMISINGIEGQFKQVDLLNEVCFFKKRARKKCTSYSFVDGLNVIKEFKVS